MFDLEKELRHLYDFEDLIEEDLSLRLNSEVKRGARNGDSASIPQGAAKWREKLKNKTSARKRKQI